MIKWTLAGTGILLSLLASTITLQPGKPSKASLERGRRVYEKVCLACHQADGGGVPRLCPTLEKTSWVLGDKKTLINIVLGGLKGGEIEIDGDRFDNPMPAQEANLTDLQVADVLTYVRNNFGNNASPVSPAEVAAVRKANAAKK